MKRYSFLLIPLFILSLLFLSCQGIAPAPTPTPPSEGEEEPSGEPTGRVVLMELFNVEGCPACKAINPVAEDLTSEYSTDEVILVELKGWLEGATPETEERFSWYVPEDRHTPFIAFNGLSDTFSEGVSGGGGGGGGAPINHAPVIISEPITIAMVEELYTYAIKANDPDGDTLTYVLTENPESMSIESETGIISWIPTSEQVEEHDVSVEVSDGNKKAIQDFIITVYNETNFLITETYAYAYAITNQVTNS
jgi:hypothetical protein